MKNKLSYRIANQKIEIYSEFTEKISKMLSGFFNFTDHTDNSGSLLQFLIESGNMESGSTENEQEYTIIHSFNLEKDNCRLNREGSKYSFTIEQDSGVRLLRLFMELGSPVVRCQLNLKHQNSDQLLPKPYHLKFSLWIAFAFEGLTKKIAAIHSSVIIFDNHAIMFLGESGTGKSTHTNLWLKNIPESRLLNDDSPILRIEDGKTFVYGSPWSGKGNCYINEKYPVKAIVRLNQHAENRIEKLSNLDSFGALYPSFPPAYLKDQYFEDQICAIISNIITSTPVYLLKCLPDRNAAEIVYKTIFIKEDLNENTKYRGT